jgi:hypothetical protein
MKKQINNEVFEMTTEEVNQFNIDLAESKLLKKRLTDKINKKKSALAKLKKLGLDEDEIKSLF